MRKDLEEIKFVFNNYDPCVTNRVINTHQQTIRFHVDDILVSHIDAKVNSDFVRWAQGKYGKLKPCRVKCRKRHDFLGMVLDFGSTPGGVHVIQKEHVSDLVKTFPENRNGKVLTHEPNELFQIG